MKKLKTLAAIFMSFTSFFTSFYSCASTEFSLLHYNIKELDSQKINQSAPQIAQVKAILQKRKFDILSLNEIQYDFPGVPNQSFKTKGQNLNKLKKMFGLPASWNSTFYPANTGLNAQKNPQGEYETNPNSPGARDLADQVNFGTLPGQYSTGALYKFSKLQENVFAKLKWKDFNPNIDLEQFSLPTGEPLPEDMPLFDKNFTDAQIKIKGKKLRLILFHTVPSFHFGNMRSPNYLRNRDQLRFLEWYLTGKTDIEVNLKNIKSIAGASYIAVGDFNVDVNDSSNPGAPVLNRLIDKSNLWIDRKDLSFTNEGGSFEPKPFRLMLDYIITSKNVIPLEGEIIHPNFDRIELGCGDEARVETRAGMVLKSYYKGRRQCNVLVSEEYDRFKRASDHYPIWGKFKIK